MERDQIEAGKKYKVNGSPMVPDGMIVTTEKDKIGNLVTGKTGMIFCQVQPAGSLFFTPEMLNPVEKQ